MLLEILMVLYFFKIAFFNIHGFEYVNVKMQLLEMLKKYKSDIRIKKKVMWAINYFNEWYKSPYYRGWERPQIAKDENNSGFRTTRTLI